MGQGSVCDQKKGEMWVFLEKESWEIVQFDFTFGRCLRVCACICVGHASAWVTARDGAGRSTWERVSSSGWWGEQRPEVLRNTLMVLPFEPQELQATEDKAPWPSVRFVGGTGPVRLCCSNWIGQN